MGELLYITIKVAYDCCCRCCWLLLTLLFCCCFRARLLDEFNLPLAVYVHTPVGPRA